MQNEINNLPKTETTEELGKINLNGKESISIKLLQEQMEIEDYIDAEYMSGKKRKKVTFFKSKDGLKYDNEKGELVNVEKFAEKFIGGRRYKISLKPDAAEVARIEKVYSEKRIELINKLNEKAKTEKLTQASTYIPFTVNTPLDQMDPDLYDALTTSFQEYVSDQDREDEVNAMNTEDIREMFEDFIRTNPAAKKVIDNYNKKKIEQLVSEQIEEIEAPVIEINGEQINFEELDIKGIKSNITKLEKNLEKLTNKSEEDLTPADKEAIALLQFNITQANKYLSYKLNIKDSPKREATLKKIRKLLDEQNNIELNRVKNKYIVKGKEQEFEKVKNATNKLLSSYYKYPDAAIITEVYDATIGAGGTVDDFMKALKAKKDLKGFSKWTFNEVESELKTRTGEETQPTTDTNVVQENQPRKPGFKNSIVKKEESTTKSGDKVTEYNSYAVDENGNERVMSGGGIITTVGELAAVSENSSAFYAEDENGDLTILKLDPNTKIKINKTIEGNDRKGNYQQRITVTLVGNNTFSGGDARTDFLTTKDIFSTPVYKTNTTTTDTTEDEVLPEGFRYVEEGEILPAGDYITKLSVGGKRTITNAPAKTVSTDTKAVDDIERRRKEELNDKETIYKNSLSKDRKNPNRSILKEDKIFTRNGKITEVGFRKIDKTSDRFFIFKYNDNIDAINARYDAELNALGTTDTTTDVEYYESPYGTIAANYLFTGGKGVILSTDYLLQALTAVFPYSGKAIDNIRNKYANELSQILKDDINTDTYNSVVQEIRDAINNTYGNEKANEIFEKIIKNATGFTLSREGNQVSSDAEKLNEEQETKINTKSTQSSTTDAKLKSTAKRKVTLNEVLALVSEKAYENKGITNTYVNAQIRNFLAGAEVEKNSEMIDDDAFDSLFGTDSILSSLKEQIDNGDLIAIPNNIKLYDETSGIAGEIDLLLIDREGKVFIVNTKIGKKDKWDTYDDPENNLSPKQAYALELTAYKNMLYNMYGIEASIGILPIQVTTDSGTGKILTVKKADGVLRPDRITFKIDVNEESVVGVDDSNNVNYGKTFQQLIDTIIERTTPTGETIEEVPLTPEDKEIQEEVKKLTAGQKKSQDRNMGILIDKIQTLRERQTLLDGDISKINDTLKFLDTILNQSIDLTTEDIVGLINNIDSLDKVTGQLIKSKLTKRGGKIQLRAKDLRAQIRREFSIANDITNRINELKREKEQLEAITRDLKKQGDYYQNLLDDPNMTIYNAAEIKQKIATVKRKISTIEKLIRIIQNAISKSVAYLKEYVKIWQTSNNNYDKFKKETGYKALSSEEIRSLIDSVDSADKATLANYPNLTKEFNKLESNLLDAMDSVELIEDVQAEETSRLNQLQGALQKYDDQLRYLNELLEPSGRESLENKISDKNSSGPKPTEVKKASAENKKQTVEAVDRSKSGKVISTFSLADMADLGEAINGEQAVNKDLRTVLEAISKAETPEEITQLSKNLKDFKAGEMKIILDVVKERLQELTKEFKDSVKDQLDTTIGAEYVTINPIGDIPAGTLIIITAVVGDNVTVAIVNTNKKKSVKFDKLIGNIMTPAQAKESTTTQVVDITKEVKSVLQTSKTAADNLSDSEIDEIIGSVKTLDLGDLEEDLFNMEIC